MTLNGEKIFLSSVASKETEMIIQDYKDIPDSNENNEENEKIPVLSTNQIIGMSDPIFQQIGLPDFKQLQIQINETNILECQIQTENQTVCHSCGSSVCFCAESFPTNAFEIQFSGY